MNVFTETESDCGTWSEMVFLSAAIARYGVLYFQLSHLTKVNIDISQKLTNTVIIIIMESKYVVCTVWIYWFSVAYFILVHIICSLVPGIILQ